jgi:hypothetical protein
MSFSLPTHWYCTTLLNVSTMSARYAGTLSRVSLDTSILLVEKCSKFATSFMPATRLRLRK